MELQAKKRFIVNVVFIALVLSITVFAGKFVLEYLFPFVLAITVAALMQRPAAVISEKTGMKKGWCAAILSAALYILLAILLTLAAVKIFSFSGKAINEISKLGVEEILNDITHYFDAFQGGFSELKATAQKILSGTLDELIGKLISSLSSTATKIIGLAPSFLFSSIVALAATCYIAKDFDGLCSFLKGIIPQKTAENLGKIKQLLKTCILKMATGYLIIMGITFLELLLGLALLRVENAVLISLLISLVDILPVLGAGAVLVPWGIVSLCLGKTFFGIGILVLYFLITLLRNFLEPKIVGNKTGISPLFILFSMFLGLRLFGVAGLIIFPVTFIVTVKYYKNEMENDLSQK